MFVLNRNYTKKELYQILKVPKEKQRGEWDKGYRTYEGNIYIFANIGIPGRTGHDYNNYWEGDLFYWEGNTHSHSNQPQIKRMLSPLQEQKVFLFTREHNKDPFTFEGEMEALSYEETSPVRIVWKFKENPYLQNAEEAGFVNENKPMYEGSIKKISVNKYERNPHARRICIKHHGTHCNVCDFDFYITYGELGEGYIHVHHIIPISALGEDYIIDPEKDLIPICPNCHSMVHKKDPPIPPLDLKKIVNERR